jgi:hypothetical protein
MAGRPGFDSRQSQEIFLHSTAFRPALGPTKPPIQLVPGVNPLGCEADHLFPCDVEVKNGGAIPSLPHMSSWNSA